MISDRISMMNFKRVLEKGYQYIGDRKDFRISKKPYKDLFVTADTAQYTFYQYAYGADKIIAAYGNITVIQKRRDENHLILCPYRNKVIRYHIYLNEKTFPGIIQGSKILSCQLIPYMREVAENKYQKITRMVIITTKAQIFHNYPARKREIEGFSKSGDIVNFEESVVWDLPERQYPSQTKECETWERFYPGLPADCYEHHPQINTSEDFQDKYGNGGFSDHSVIVANGRKRIVPRFYLYSRDLAANPFHYIGTGEKDYKMSLMATYRSNVHCGVRTCIFASTDGGRNWYCKYEFTDAGEYEFAQGDVEDWGKNFGNPVIDPELKEIDWTTVRIFKRNLVVPSYDNKEPDKLFRWTDCGEVKKIADGKQLLIEFKNQHLLKTGNIIAFSSTLPTDDDCWIMNNQISETSSGNNLFFKVEVLDDKQIVLYEFVANPAINIPCRHIHHVNKIKDGWIWGTGEIYPNGWIMYMQMKEADTFAIKHAWEEFKIVRLNSAEESIQRTMGVILKDDSRGTIIYASDHDTLKRREIETAAGRDLHISRNSTGIFKGCLSDIDNRNKFQTVYEAGEPCFYFQSLDNMLIFSGQRGEIAISFDDGTSWLKERIAEPLIRYYGNCGQIYYFDQAVLVRK
ncbi:hypothetical protein [Lactonifactor longoviformis]|uniref:hypothetical protein n=1 Tax=Lactonifactor longoviformis TaxID=341220 RepID=UPI0036F3E591